jgi:hypothetical protein
MMRLDSPDPGADSGGEELSRGNRREPEVTQTEQVVALKADIERKV